MRLREVEEEGIQEVGEEQLLPQERLQVCLRGFLDYSSQRLESGHNSRLVSTQSHTPESLHQELVGPVVGGRGLLSNRVVQEQLSGVQLVSHLLGL